MDASTFHELAERLAGFFSSRAAIAVLLGRDRERPHMEDQCSIRSGKIQQFFWAVAPLVASEGTAAAFYMNSVIKRKTFSAANHPAVTQTTVTTATMQEAHLEGDNQREGDCHGNEV